jgi:hypothetical protein
VVFEKYFVFGDKKTFFIEIFGGKKHFPLFWYGFEPVYKTIAFRQKEEKLPQLFISQAISLFILH